jgi:hypothetical protein
VSWVPVAWNVVGERGAGQQTPNLAAVLQAIVDRPGWASGQAVVLIVTGSGKRVAGAYDVGANAAPVLHVGYRP